jgi:hypothetical protein
MTTRPHAGASWIKWIGLASYVALICGFAYQTYLLVTWLFPTSDLFMQIITVFSFDVCSALWAWGEMFYPFRAVTSRHIAFGMWIATFIGSVAASVIWMGLQFIVRYHEVMSPDILRIAYGLVIAIFVGNIIATTVIVRKEYRAANPLIEDQKVLPQQVQSITGPDLMTMIDAAIDRKTTSGPIPAVDPQIERLKQLAAAAAQKGYDLDKLESMLGVSPNGRKRSGN